MKTLNLIAKAGRKNFFFGNINAKGQELVITFNSAIEMADWFSKRSDKGNWYTNEFSLKRVIKNEYSQSRTYYSRFELEKIENCTKIFNKLAK
jgi:hypothetical protein